MLEILTLPVLSFEGAAHQPHHPGAVSEVCPELPRRQTDDQIVHGCPVLVELIGHDRAAHGIVL
jgi:hypothetical protein